MVVRRCRLRSIAGLTIVLVAVAAACAPASGAATAAWVTNPGYAGGYTESVSCPTVSFCVAVNANGAAVRYDGHSWDAGTVLAPNSGGTFGAPLTGVSCTSASFCVAVDSVGNAFTYNGTGWSAAVSVDPGVQLNSVSCPTTTYCHAADVSGNQFADLAGAWTQRTQSGGINVACYADSACWTFAGLPKGAYASNTGGVTCLTTPFCMAVTPDGHYGTWTSGTAFPAVKPVANATMLSAVACSSETLCVALDGPDAVFYVYDGTNWTATPYHSLYKLNAASCVPGGLCVAIDAGGDVLSYPTALPTSPTRKPTPKPTAAQIRKRLAPLLRSSLSGKAVTALLKHRRETVTWKAVSAGRLVLTLNVVVKGKRVKAATATARYTAGRAGKVVLKLTRAGRRALAGKGQRKLVLTATFTPAGAHAVSATRTVVIRR